MKIIQRWSMVLFVLMLSSCATTNHEDTPPTAEPVSKDSRAADLNMRLGLNYMQRGDYAIALQKLEKALRQDPNLPTAHNTIAILYQRLGENDSAEMHYLKAISLEPGYSEAQNNFGVFLCQQGRYKEAEERFLKAIENPLYKQVAQAYENAGLCSLNVPNIELAESYFRKALQIQPRLSKSLFEMADLSYQRADYLQARAYMQRYQAAANWTAPALYLAIKTENKLGDQNAVASYSLILKSRFPDSDEYYRVNQGLID